MRAQPGRNANVGMSVTFSPSQWRVKGLIILYRSRTAKSIRR
jgi:hypothetical protein